MKVKKGGNETNVAMEMKELKDAATWIGIGREIPGIEIAAEFVQRPDCGAVNLFTGITRNHEKGKEVRTLFYDCYEEMALTELKKIADAVRNRHSLGNLLIWHRIGEVPIGACSLVVAVSSAHRKDAIHATRELIDTLKKEVPIWKKETFRDGVMWKEEQ